MESYIFSNLFIPSAVCVHGTYRKNLDLILQSGLKRMARLHIHFSSGLPLDGGVISGMLSFFRDTSVLNMSIEESIMLS